MMSIYGGETMKEKEKGKKLVLSAEILENRISPMGISPDPATGNNWLMGTQAQNQAAANGAFGPLPDGYVWPGFGPVDPGGRH